MALTSFCQSPKEQHAQLANIAQCLRHAPCRSRRRPAGRLAHLFHDVIAFVFRHRGQVGAAHRRGGDLDARAGVQAQGDRRRTTGRVDVNHREPIAAAEAHHALAEFSQFLHQGMRELADIQPRQHHAGQAERGGAETVLGAFLHVDQILELGERVREPRYRGFGQAAALAQFLIAEHAVAVAKAGQHLESARQGRHEVAVLGQRFRASGRRNLARLIH